MPFLVGFVSRIKLTGNNAGSVCTDHLNQYTYNDLIGGLFNLNFPAPTAANDLAINHGPAGWGSTIDATPIQPTDLTTFYLIADHHQCQRYLQPTNAINQY